MKIMDFLAPKAVSTTLTSANKKDVVEELLGLLINAGAVEKKHKSKVLEVLMAREALGSTAIGQGIAIPHGKTDKVSRLVAVLGISKHGVNFDALDGEPVYIFFLLVAPKETAGPHLKALAQISRLLRDSYFCELIRKCKTEQEVFNLIKTEEEKKR